MKRIKIVFNNLIENTKKKIRQIKKEHLIRQFLQENYLLLAFIITNVINSTLLRFFCMHSIENFLSIKAILADIVVTMFIGSFSFLFKPKNRFIYLLSFSIFLTLICIVNSVYYTFYTSFASISMISLTQYISDVGDAVVENVVQLKDLIYITCPVILIFINTKLKKKNYYKRVDLKSERKRKTVKSLCTTGILLLLFLVTMSSLDVSRFIKQWNKEYIVMRFGIYIYQFNDVVTSIQPKISSMFGYDKANKEFNDYYKDVPSTSQTNEYTDIFKGKNVIVIHAESMMTNVMDMEFNGEKVAPNLSRIASEGMFFSNFYSQVSVGTSSDSELTFTTSLLPTKSGTAFVSYYDRTYITVPKMFKELGYYTFCMHANNADFWNRRNMYKSIGYDKFYSKVDYKIDKDKVIGLGLSDKEFFKQSITKLKKIDKNNNNWYGLFIMLSNHTPFSSVDKYGEYPVDIKETITTEDGKTEEKVYPYMENTKVGNYLKSYHYADSALGEFIENLDKEGLLENTVLIIYGDHDARLPKKDYNLMYNYDKENDDVLDENYENYKEYDSYQYELGRKVPFIIWTKDMKDTKLNFKNENVMGMYDAMPTIGNMFGFYNKYALGHDIFNTNSNNIVVFPNGNWVTNKMYYNSQKSAYLPLTEEEITEEEITNNSSYANKLLDVSNNIITFDLFNQEKNMSLKKE